MAGILKKIDTFFDILRKNKLLFLFGFATLTGSNAGQYYYTNHNQPIVKETVKQDIIINRTVIQKLNYSKVEKLIKDHIKELH